MNPMYLLYALLALIAYKFMTLKASLTVTSNKVTPKPLLPVQTTLPTPVTIVTESEISSNTLPTPVVNLSNMIPVSNQLDVENTYQPIVAQETQPIYDYTDTIHFGTSSIQSFVEDNYNQTYY